MNISPNRWNIIQRIIREYPNSSKELNDIKDRRQRGDGAYYKRLRQECDAVEKAFEELSDEEKTVVRERYWQDRERCTSYEIIERRMNAHYSVRQMKRIIAKMSEVVGKYLGQIK